LETVQGIEQKKKMLKKKRPTTHQNVFGQPKGKKHENEMKITFVDGERAENEKKGFRGPELGFKSTENTLKIGARGKPNPLNNKHLRWGGRDQKAWTDLWGDVQTKKKIKNACQTGETRFGLDQDQRQCFF